MRTVAPLLAATLCAAAFAVHAQGTYLPGAIYPPVFAPFVLEPSTNVLGAGSLGGPPQSTGPGSMGYAAADLARAFYAADLNHDGDLTQVEASRLGIGVSAFNEMDRNNDGVLSRGELEDALR